MAVLTHCGISLFSFGLLALAFHPADQWWLGWVAMAPWMAWHQVRPRRGTQRALMLGAFLFLCSVLQWVGEVAPFMVPLIPLLGLPFVALTGWTLDRLIHRFGMSDLVAYPLVLVSAQWLRDQVLGVSWGDFGYTQWRWIEGVQTAALCRVHLLSFVVLLGNVAAARVLLAVLGRRAWREAGRACAVAGVAIVLVHGLGAWRIRAAEASWTPGPRVVGIQGNIPQFMKSERTRAQTWDAQLRQLESAKEAIDPDLVIFAETSFRRIWPEETVDSALAAPLPIPGTPFPTWGATLPRGRGQLTILGYSRLRIWTPESGVADEDGDGFQEWNAAGAVRDGGLVAEFSKRVLMPFGEHLPWPTWLPGREAVKAKTLADAGYIPDTTAGTTFVAPWVPLAEGGRAQVGLNICYEMVFPDEWRDQMRAQNPHILVNISNDGWFGDSNELDLVHVAARFRAVETGRAVVRVTNTGISTSVDPVGRYRAVVEGPGGGRKGVAGILLDQVPVATGTTLWVRWGDWAGAGFPAVLGVLVLTARRRKGFPIPSPKR